MLAQITLNLVQAKASAAHREQGGSGQPGKSHPERTRGVEADDEGVRRPASLTAAEVAAAVTARAAALLDQPLVSRKLHT